MSTNRKDKFLELLCMLAALLCAALVLAIFCFLFFKSIPALREIGVFRLFSDDYWNPSPVAVNGQFNLMPMLVGSLVVSLLALLIATPIGILSCIGIVFYTAHKPAKYIEQIFSIFAGIPSVVLGFWGIVCVSPLVAKIDGPGPALITGSVVLAIMILPTLTLAVLSALRSSSKELLSLSLSLGMSKISCFIQIILPSIKGAVFGGILLSLMRALGETMIVTMLCGNIPKLPENLFSPVRTLTANIALEMAYAYDVHSSALFVSGLMLLTICTLIVILIQNLKRSCEYKK